MFYKKIFCVVLVLCLCAALPIDLYIAGLPTIAHDLASSDFLVQSTVSVLMLGFGLAQFVYGPVSDRIGRKKTIIIALLIAIVGTLICNVAGNIYVLITGRLIQGIGASACLSMPRSIIRDLFKAEQMAKFNSYVAACLETMTAIAPFIGGFIIEHFGWRANFSALLLLNVLALVLTLLLLPETNRNLDHHSFNLRQMGQTYKNLSSDLQFVFYVGCGCVAYTNLILYFTVSPFLLQNTLHLSPQQYGFVTLFVTFSLVVGAIINAKFVTKLGIAAMVTIAICLMLIAGSLLLIADFLHTINVLMILTPAIICITGSALIFTNGVAGALQNLSKNIGLACALYGGLQILGSFILIAWVTELPASNLSKLAFTYTFSGLSLLTFMAILKKHNKLKVLS